ncbi:TPA: hypothetical protein ACXIJH_005044 [Serratia marcescens]
MEHFGNIKPFVKNGEVVIVGKVSKEENNKIINVIKKLNDSYENKIPIYVKTDLIIDKIPFKIQQIVNKMPKFIVTNDGTVIFVGETYQGMTLLSIEDKAVVFSGEQIIKVKW